MQRNEEDKSMARNQDKDKAAEKKAAEEKAAKEKAQADGAEGDTDVSPRELLESLRSAQEQMSEQQQQIQHLLQVNSALRTQAEQGISEAAEALNGDLPQFKMVEVQFTRPFSFAGRQSGQKNIMRHRHFSADGGEICRLPLPLCREFNRDYPGLLVTDRGKFKARVVGRIVYDPKTQRGVPEEETIPLEELLAHVRDVGIPCVH